jgi:hypothetical protein
VGLEMAIETMYNFFHAKISILALRIEIEKSSSFHVILIWASRIEILCNFSHANASILATQKGILWNFCHVDILTWGLRSETDCNFFHVDISISVFLSVIGCLD